MCGFLRLRFFVSRLPAVIPNFRAHVDPVSFTESRPESPMRAGTTHGAVRRAIRILEGFLFVHWPVLVEQRRGHSSLAFVRPNR